MAIVPGYMGKAQVGGNILYCSDFNINVKQEALFYDHTIGLRDSSPTSIYELKKDDGKRNKQGIIMRPGVKIIQGGVSFYWTNNSIGGLFNSAKTGDDFNIDLYYACDETTKSFKHCKINSYTAKFAAGEIVNSSAEIIARSINSDPPIFSDPSEAKLITWDIVKVTPSIFSTVPISYFEFSINNGCMPIYTAKGNEDNNLLPLEIRVGMQKLSGTIGFFGNTILNDLVEGTINIKIQDGTIALFDQTLEVVFLPNETAGTVGPVVTTTRFVGRDANIT